VFAPRLAAETEPCATCGALLAADQRYCLSCGERRARTRVPFPAPAPPVVAAAAPPPPPRPRAPLPSSALSALYGLAGAGALALGLLVGILLMGDDTPAPVVAAATPAAAVAAQPTAAAPVTTPTPEATIAATFTPDWPAGQNGWTIQLKTLPKDGTAPEAIATAKADATGQGATGVGALDSDTFASLDGGNYVIYSGVSTTKKAAEDVFSTLQANFPDASVVEVSDQAPEKVVKKSSADLKKAEQAQTPEDAQKNTRKAPPTVESEGPAPTPDSKKPGAGSDTTEIG
jgi:hypothetical protein